MLQIGVKYQFYLEKQLKTGGKGGNILESISMSDRNLGVCVWSDGYLPLSDEEHQVILYEGFWNILRTDDDDESFTGAVFHSQFQASVETLKAAAVQQGGMLH